MTRVATGGRVVSRQPIDAAFPDGETGGGNGRPPICRYCGYWEKPASTASGSPTSTRVGPGAPGGCEVLIHRGRNDTQSSGTNYAGKEERGPQPRPITDSPTVLPPISPVLVSSFGRKSRGSITGRRSLPPAPQQSHHHMVENETTTTGRGRAAGSRTAPEERR
jgi:hypothetical protein